MSERPPAPIADLGRARENVQLKAKVTELQRLVDAYRATGGLSDGQLSDHSYECHHHKETDADGNVIRIYVQHLRVLVDPEIRKVICASCRTELDPINVLNEYAIQERQFARATKHMVDEQKNLRAEIDALKKQRQNLRSAIRKDGGRPVDEYEVRFAAQKGVELDIPAQASIEAKQAEDRIRRATRAQDARREIKRQNRRHQNSAAESMSADTTAADTTARDTTSRPTSAGASEAPDLAPSHPNSSTESKSADSTESP